MTDTVYTAAFDGNKFLMVYNQKRKGWEMPGGHIESGETPEDAARREFMEESGYDVQLIDKKIDHGAWIFVAKLGGKKGKGEMKSSLFQELPSELAFGLDEYTGVLEWARSLL